MATTELVPGYVTVVTQKLSPVLALGCTDPKGNADIVLTGSPGNPNKVFLPAGWKLSQPGVVEALFAEKVVFKWRCTDPVAENKNIYFEQWACGSATINGQSYSRGWSPDTNNLQPGAYEIQQFGDFAATMMDSPGHPWSIPREQLAPAQAGPADGTWIALKPGADIANLVANNPDFQTAERQGATFKKEFETYLVRPASRGIARKVFGYFSWSVTVTVTATGAQVTATQPQWHDGTAGSHAN